MQVEAVRSGWIFGQDDKQHKAWRAKLDSTSVGLTGASLERVVMGLAISHPDLVAMRD